MVQETGANKMLHDAIPLNKYTIKAPGDICIVGNIRKVIYFGGFE